MAKQSAEPMNTGEVRAIGGVALVYAFRMLGMFMVLPVLATYGLQLKDATPTLIGAAIGAYGLTQGILQIPVGMLSDRIGRLPVVAVGLVIFAAGSLLAGQAHNIWGVIAGRVVQGAGAISAALLALLADLTREQQRTKAMAILGMSIGLSFAVAMVVGPLLTRAFGLAGLFRCTALMALVGLAVVLLVLPRAARQRPDLGTTVMPDKLSRVLADSRLQRLDGGIFCLHFILMASFTALPLALVHRVGLPKEEHWWVYLATLLVSFVAMMPLIIYGETQRRLKQVCKLAVSLLLICELFFCLWVHSLVAMLIGLLLFFIAFNVLEASLPSLVSKTAPLDAKGTAMGLYSTSQFLGAALGGLCGGWVYQHAGLTGSFICCALITLIWVLLPWPDTPYLSSWPLLLPGAVPTDLVARLLAAEPGVKDAVVMADGPAESILYVKVDTQQLDRSALEQLVQDLCSNPS